MTVQEVVPQGMIYNFTMESTDSKFYPDASGGDETIGPRIAREFLENQNVEEKQYRSRKKV